MKPHNTSKKDPSGNTRRQRSLIVLSLFSLLIMLFAWIGDVRCEEGATSEATGQTTGNTTGETTKTPEPLPVFRENKAENNQVVGPGFEMIPDDADKNDVSSEVSVLHRMFGRSRLRDFAEHEITATDIRKQPFLYFRHWARKRLPLVPSFLFLLFVSITASASFSKRLQTAKEACRARFWRCMGRAVLTFALMLIFARFLFMTQIGTPLALLMIALAQLIGMAGLAVGISLIGDGVCSRSGLNKPDWREMHPRQSLVLTSVVGTIVTTVILMIPGIGLFPPIGTRIVLLIATLGAGGLLRTRFGRTSES